MVEFRLLWCGSSEAARATIETSERNTITVEALEDIWRGMKEKGPFGRESFRLRELCGSKEPVDEALICGWLTIFFLGWLSSCYIFKIHMCRFQAMDLFIASCSSVVAAGGRVSILGLCWQSPSNAYGKRAGPQSLHTRATTVLFYIHICTPRRIACGSRGHRAPRCPLCGRCCARQLAERLARLQRKHPIRKSCTHHQ